MGSLCAAILRDGRETAAYGGLLRMRVFPRRISPLMVRSVALATRLEP
jgi:hypothetical protein